MLTVTQCVARWSGQAIHYPSVRHSSSHHNLPLLTVPQGLEFPYATALLSDQTIQVHNIESQEVVQSVPAPPLPSPNEASLSALLSAERRALAMSPNGFFVPSQQRPEKLWLKNVNILNRNAKPGGREADPIKNGEEHIVR